MNRDPIEEKGGLNLYGFVNNDPNNAYDVLGKYTRNGRIIYVEGCEIVIVFGHNYGPDKQPLFNFSKGNKYSGGGFVGCKPCQVNDNIPKRRRVPFPRFCDDIVWQGPDIPLNLRLRQIRELIDSGDKNAMPFLLLMQDQAQRLARAWCQESNCSSIKVRFIREAGIKDKETIPEMEDFEITCASKLPGEDEKPIKPH